MERALKTQLQVEQAPQKKTFLLGVLHRRTWTSTADAVKDAVMSCCHMTAEASEQQSESLQAASLQDQLTGGDQLWTGSLLGPAGTCWDPLSQLKTHAWMPDDVRV